ncbi:MAG: hypothetical protein ABIQ32_12605 [Sphingomicrobium sp.]
MKQAVSKRVGRFAFLATFLLCAQPGFAREPLELDAKGNVLSFYGVTVNLTRSGLKRLPYRVTAVHHPEGEGDAYTSYKIRADGGVVVEVTFDDDGKLYSGHTKSANALGPRGIGVGSTLAQVKAAWPTGTLLYGFEDGAFVTYSTAANVLFRFDPKDMPPGAFDHDRPSDFPVPQDIKVGEISIYPRAFPPPKEADPIDLTTSVTTIENGARAIINRLEVRQLPGSSKVRLVWYDQAQPKFDGVIDVSSYPEFDIHARRIRHDSGPVLLSFRYGNFKNCSVREDDRDSVFVVLDQSGARLSATAPPGIKVWDDYALTKYVGDLMTSAAHGCRRTYDPKTGAFGLEAVK